MANARTLTLMARELLAKNSGGIDLSKFKTQEILKFVNRSDTDQAREALRILAKRKDCMASEFVDFVYGWDPFGREKEDFSLEVEFFELYATRKDFPSTLLISRMAKYSQRRDVAYKAGAEREPDTEVPEGIIEKGFEVAIAKGDITIDDLRETEIKIFRFDSLHDQKVWSARNKYSKRFTEGWDALVKHSLVGCSVKSLVAHHVKFKHKTSTLPDIVSRVLVDLAREGRLSISDRLYILEHGIHEEDHLRYLFENKLLTKLTTPQFVRVASAVSALRDPMPKDAWQKILSEEIARPKRKRELKRLAGL